ncbi:hypothetical protein IEE92_10745 [Kocuria sp. cx-116]|uniref:hypothetical protein n=1 Tax=Kocuria sp. cx-116 TaxID=2771378 RepID=UPI001683D247|nr:hypothetical protein [Kocuria sp. cx-116]MBD2763021.1 hypothetical protein [Kocuria sp. cx-116]
MSFSPKSPSALEPHRSWRAPLVFLVVIAVIVGALVWLGPTIANQVRMGEGRLYIGAECSVDTSDGTSNLSRDQAKLATTAVALAARGAQTPDISGIDSAVIQRLAEGSPDDVGPGLRCEGTAADDVPEQELTPTGLTPPAQHVREEMAAVFGDLPLGGFAPGGVSQGHGAESTHYSGRGIDVFFRPVTEENRCEGWILAQWLIAHADDLDIQYVIFDDKIWSAHSPRGHWQTYGAPEPANDILRHRDHVHVDVLRGGPR